MDAGTILAVIAILISITSLANSVKQAKATRRIEIETMLHDAWDLVGGKSGTETILDFSSVDNLILARRSVEKAIMLNPKYPKSRYMLAVVFEGLEKIDSAEKEYLKSLTLSKYKLFPAIQNLGTIMLKSDRSEDAIKLFKKALPKCDDKSELHFNLGVVYLSAKDTANAIAHFEKSIVYDKTKSKAYSNLIAALSMDNNFEKAEHYLEMAITNMAESADLYGNACVMYQMAKNKTKLQIYQKKYTQLSE